MTWENTLRLVILMPLVIILLIHIWYFHIRPRLIPSREIDGMVDRMQAAFGPYAEREAFLRQRDAWYRDDILAEAIWMQIRRRLRRRWRQGLIVLHDETEAALSPLNDLPSTGEIAPRPARRQDA